MGFNHKASNSNYYTPISSTDNLNRHLLEYHGHVYIDNKYVAYNKTPLKYRNLRQLGLVEEGYHDTIIAKYGLTFANFYKMAIEYKKKISIDEILNIFDVSDINDKNSLIAKSEELEKEFKELITDLRTIDREKDEYMIHEIVFSAHDLLYKKIAVLCERYDILTKKVLSISDIAITRPEDSKPEEKPLDKPYPPEPERPIKDPIISTPEGEDYNNLPMEGELNNKPTVLPEVPSDTKNSEESDSPKVVPDSPKEKETEGGETSTDSSSSSSSSITEEEKQPVVTEKEVKEEVAEESKVPSEDDSPKKEEVTEESKKPVEDEEKLGDKAGTEVKDDSFQEIPPKEEKNDDDTDSNSGSVVPKEEVVKREENNEEEHAVSSHPETSVNENAQESSEAINITAEQKTLHRALGADDVSKVISHLVEKAGFSIEDEYLSILDNYLANGEARETLFDAKNIVKRANLGHVASELTVKIPKFTKESSYSHIRDIAITNVSKLFETLKEIRIHIDLGAVSIVSGTEPKGISRQALFGFNILRLFLANLYIIKHVDIEKSKKQL